MLNIQSLKREPAVWFLPHFINFEKDKFDIFAFPEMMTFENKSSILSQSLAMQLQPGPVWLTSWQPGSLTARLRHKSDKSCDDQHREPRL